MATMTAPLGHFANPARVMRVADALFPWCAGGFALLCGLGLWLSLAASPPDYQQGEAVRIMYVHVPAAYLATMAYALVAGSAVAYLIWRRPMAHLAGRAAAPVGMAFTAVCLITGAVWGKPTWGAWWVWDARLTSVLVLLFLYAGYIALDRAFDDPWRGSRPAAAVAVAGIVNLPIIKFSVDWWNTLHQPASLLRLDGPAMPPSMLAPLLTMMGAFTLFFAAAAIMRLRAEVARARAQSLRLSLSAGGGA